MKAKPVPLLGGLSALLLGVGFYYFLYTPRAEELEVVRAETVQLETDRASLHNEIAALREVEANEVQIRAQLARLEQYIPSGTAQSTAVQQFQLIADAAGVEIVSVAFSSPQLVENSPPTGDPETSLARIPITMAVDGGYFQVVDFFRRLETETARAVYVGNLEATEAEDGFPELTSTWIGDMFAVVPTPEASIPAPPAPTDVPAEEGADDAGEPGDAVDGTAEDDTAEDLTT